MSIALLLARVLLAGVFTVAGLAKLADRAGSRQALIGFGLPVRLATPGSILLPLGELVVAAALIPVTSAWWGAAGALTLILLLIVGIVFTLAHGRTPECHCFGQLYSKPIGWPTLLRNLLLAAVAGVIVGFGYSSPGLSAMDWFGSLTFPQRIELLGGILLVVLLGGMGWLLLHVLRQQGRLLLRIEALEEQVASARVVTQPAGGHTQVAPSVGLPVGIPAPSFALANLSGETITLDFLRSSGKPIFLLFSDPGCGPCNALLPEVGRWKREYRWKVTLALISRGSAEANRTKASEHGITQVLLQQDREIATAYQAYGTPSAVLIRTDGTIGSPLAQGADAIRALVAQTVGLPALHSVPSTDATNENRLPLANNGHAQAASRPAALKLGESAPSFSLPDLTGRMVNLADFRGRQTLVLFWNPGCGFCQRMLDDLKAWEAKPPKDAPKLLVISTGTVEANQALSLQAPILLDQGSMSVGSTFGANGTPMAILVDAKGRIASEVAAGAPAVLALASQKQDNTTHV